MKAGQPVILFNGLGGEYRGELVEVRKGFVSVQINALDTIDRESPLYIHLAIGLSRGERMDWIVQKATELGVAQITPLFTQRCEVKLSTERLAKKTRHWQQVAISACEQCQRTKLPIINPASPLPQWLPNCAEDLKLVMHHRADIGLQNLRQKKRSVCLLIGPEGGLSDQEIEGATHRGFQALAMGPRVLRTETAPVAAISILQALWGDLQ
jgi:16S rRNA (uracil1498-N3)-methyltransferase